MSFLQPAFIRKNTPELKEKLIKQGHQLCPCCDGLDGWLFTSTSSDVHAIHKEEQSDFLADIKNRPNEMIDCETNELMFLALAALRDDSDYMQWFTNGKEFILCNREDWGDMISCLCCGGKYNYDKGGELSDKFHKATVEELIEHFKDE